LNIPLVAQIPLVQSIRESSDIGKPSVLESGSDVSLTMIELAQNVAQQVAIRNAMQPVEAN
jgi:ATP-binding protein involved in chromosome partitioning